jgi:hypothetical protein
MTRAIVLVFLLALGATPLARADSVRARRSAATACARGAGGPARGAAGAVPAALAKRCAAPHGVRVRQAHATRYFLARADALRLHPAPAAPKLRAFNRRCVPSPPRAPPPPRAAANAAARKPAPPAAAAARRSDRAPHAGRPAPEAANPKIGRLRICAADAPRRRQQGAVVPRGVGMDADADALVEGFTAFDVDNLIAGKLTESAGETDSQARAGPLRVPLARAARGSAVSLPAVRPRRWCTTRSSRASAPRCARPTPTTPRWTPGAACWVRA